MSNSFVLAIDQGTSSTKTLIFDQNGKPIVKASVPLKTHYLDGHKVEQEPEAIYQNVIDSATECLKSFEAQGHSLSKIVSIGISNQRETFVLWDKDGSPLHNAVVWQCKRSIQVCEALKEKEGFEDLLRSKTGLIVDPYFSGSKVVSLFQNDPKIQKAIESGEAYFGTVDSWLLFKMTDGEAYYTDHTNASRTMFMNLDTLDWDREILSLLDLQNLNLPEIVPSTYNFGATDLSGLFPSQVAISSMIGDSHAAAFGEGCFEIGDAKATLGTGCSILMNVGQKRPESNSGMVSTICWSIDGRVDYALEGIIVSCGSTIEWVKNQLGLFEDTSALQSICEKLENNGGVYIVPAFSGLGAPHWDMTRKASIEGLTFDSTKEHVIRAAVESVPYQIKDVISAMEADCGSSLNEIRVDGGITSNDFVIQLLIDLLGTQVTKISLSDVSAMGAGYLAGLQAKVYESLDQLKSFHIHSGNSDKSDFADTAISNYATWRKYITD